MTENYLNQFVDRGAYSEQYYFEFGEFVLKNKDDDYLTLVDKISKKFFVDTRYRILRKVERIGDFSKGLERQTRTVIEYQYAIYNNKLTKELEEEFKKIKIIKKAPIVPVVSSKYSIPELPFATKEDEQEKVDKIVNAVNLIISGKSIDEASAKAEISRGAFDGFITKYLPKNPEAFVAYKMYIKNIEPIDIDEVNQYKEVIIYFIKNLEKTIETIEEGRLNPETNKRKLMNEVYKVNSLLTMYKKSLEILENKNCYKSSEIHKIEKFIYKYCLYYQQVNNFEKNLKTNYTSDEKQEEIYRIYGLKKFKQKN